MTLQDKPFCLPKKGIQKVDLIWEGGGGQLKKGSFGGSHNFSIWQFKEFHQQPPTSQKN